MSAWDSQNKHQSNVVIVKQRNKIEVAGSAVVMLKM